MKVLIVSLLRLGDMIMHAELIPAVRKKYPQAEIHFLINSQFSFAQDLFPDVKAWHHLDRNKIQQILVEQTQSPRAAFHCLDQTVQQINAEKFAVVFNATHNQLSLRLMDLIEAPQKHGAAYHDGKKIAFSNRWLAYFNDQFSELKASRFHYIELLHKALDLEVGSIRHQQERISGPILLQVLTADPKKNWSIAKFKQLKESILHKNPEEKIFAICSPSEKEDLLKIFSKDEILAVSLVQAKEALNSAKLLITGDTSIQHLAASVGTPTIALHLGSADPAKTSPWLLGSQVLQGSSACSPCRHSDKCFQPQHLCGDNLTVSSVAHQVQSYLHHNAISQIEKNGEHHFYLNILDYKKSSALKLEQLAWGFYLDGQQAQDVFILPEIGVIDATLGHRYAKLDQELMAISVKIEKLSASVFSTDGRNIAIQQAREVERDVQKLQTEYSEIGDSFIKILQSYEDIERSFFQFLKGLRAGFKQIQTLNDIRQRLILIELRKPAVSSKLKLDLEVPFE